MISFHRIEQTLQDTKEKKDATFARSDTWTAFRRACSHPLTHPALLLQAGAQKSTQKKGLSGHGRRCPSETKFKDSLAHDAHHTLLRAGCNANSINRFQFVVNPHARLTRQPALHAYLGRVERPAMSKVDAQRQNLYSSGAVCKQNHYPQSIPSTRLPLPLLALLGHV